MSGARRGPRRGSAAPSAHRRIPASTTHDTVPRSCIIRRARSDREERASNCSDRDSNITTAAASAAAATELAETISRALADRGKRRLILPAGSSDGMAAGRGSSSMRDEGLSYGELDQLRRHGHGLHRRHRASGPDRLCCATTHARAGARLHADSRLPPLYHRRRPGRRDGARKPFATRAWRDRPLVTTIAGPVGDRGYRDDAISRASTARARWTSSIVSPV